MWGWLITTWFLGLLALVGYAYMLGGHKPWPRVAVSLWGLAVLWFVGGLAYFAYEHHELGKPSLVYVMPGFWSPSPVPKWLMLVRHYGPHPVYNIELVLMDEDKRRTVAGQRSATPEQIAAMTATFHLPEMDPTENFWATQFPWSPAVPAHEHFSVVVTSREGRFGETLNIEQIRGKWFYEMTITNLRTLQLVTKCRDAGFPGWRLWPFTSRCFPNYVTEHMGE
jgi:hypothetical protein